MFMNDEQQQRWDNKLLYFILILSSHQKKLLECICCEYMIVCPIDRTAQLNQTVKYRYELAAIKSIFK